MTFLVFQEVQIPDLEDQKLLLTEQRGSTARKTSETPPSFSQSLVFLDQGASGSGTALTVVPTSDSDA